MTKAKKLIRWADCPKCKVETEYKFSTDVYQTAIYQCPKCKSIYTERALESNALLVRQGKDDKVKKTSWEEEFDRLSRTFVGQRGWVSVTDNNDGYAIWPEEYSEVKTFIRQVRQEAIRETLEAIEEARAKAHHIMATHPEFKRGSLKAFVEDTDYIQLVVNGMELFGDCLEAKIAELKKKEGI